jgi:proteasome lid subunit RPN8/RPN11
MSSLSQRPMSPGGTTLQIFESALSVMHNHVLACFPRAAVGLLWGEPSGGVARVTVAQPLQRVATPANDTHLPPPEARGLTLVGTYRSRPDHSASWSDRDQHRTQHGHSTVLVAVHGKDGPHGDGVATRIVDTRAWRLQPDGSGFRHATLHITAPPNPAEP